MSDPPALLNAPVHISEGKREGVVPSVPPAQQARELAPTCPPSWVPLHEDGSSFPKI